ncbi:uncharacterized protein LOC135130302 [Zophobas morio]|uniref:uncharacterized protein LOC135130302 n=1 Tax=Zophobas morio TaxID=2755281 RepID=UPI0030836755
MDHPDQVSSGTCTHCGKRFASCKLKNRHIKRIHGMVAQDTRRSHVLCPLCKEGNGLKTYENLRHHIEQIHEVPIEHVKFEFSSEQQYEGWKNAEKVEAKYAKYRTTSCKSYKTVNYECNRSNTKGYESNYCKRTEKAGGTIKIPGVCPSKLIVKIHSGGEITVDYWRTHVGHQEDELRCQHLSTVDKNMVVEKLKSGISIDKILEDTRKQEGPKLERINLLNKKDIAYLSNKHNIEKKQESKNKKTAENFEQNSQIGVNHQEKTVQKEVDEVPEPNSRIIKTEYLMNWIAKLNDETFGSFWEDIQGAMRKADQKSNRTTKRKIKNTFLQKNVKKSHLEWK